MSGMIMRRVTGFGCILSALTWAGGFAVAQQAKPDFGPNVMVFSPSMKTEDIKAQIAKVYTVQQRNEFGPERNALLFLPGDYKVNVPIGFYTEVIGLGASPDDVRIA